MVKKGKRISIAILTLLISVCGCSINQQAAPEKIIQEATPPEGVIRYCWEEPIVDQQKVDAGLDMDGHWYRPGHIAVREVRMGRWRPCREITSRTYGRYGNER